MSSNLNISQNIEQLLFKKVLASNFENFDKNSFTLSPKNKIFIEPTVLTQFRMPVFKKIIIILLCLCLLTLYTFKFFSVKKNINNKKLNLIYSLTKEQIYRKAKLSSLYEFLNSDRFGISKKDEIWVELKSMNLRHNYKNLHVVFDISLNLYASQFSIYKRAKVLAFMYLKLFKFLKSKNKKDYFFLVLKEYIFDETVLIHTYAQKIKKVITTQNHLMFQPLLFEMKDIEKRRFMMWYSSNSLPLRYKDAKLSRHGIPKKVYQYMKIDQHWVWTKEHSNYLKNTLNVKTCIKGPMLFYIPGVIPHDAKKIDILIFDVTPSADHNINKNSIFNANEAKTFVTDILNICNNLEREFDLSLNVFLKPKRKYSKTHDFHYIDFLRSLQSKGRIQILNFDENIYDIVKSSKIIIGYPFVSPVIIGRESKIPSFFYSSSNRLKKTSENYANFFIQSSKKLQLELRKLLVGQK